MRQIYDAYLRGQGKNDIARELNRQGIHRTGGREVWHPGTVAYILTNISYTGDMIWQKSYATNEIPFRQVRNMGQQPKYFVEDCHEPIISKEDFERVQMLMSSRRTDSYGKQKKKTEGLLAGKVYCGSCGTLFRRKGINNKIYWACRKHDQLKENCPIPQISQAELTKAILRLTNKLKQGCNDILLPLIEQLKELREKELRANRKVNDIDKEIAQLTEQNHVLVRLQSKGYVDSALYLSQLDEIDRKLKDLRRLRRRIMEATAEDAQIVATEGMMDFLDATPDFTEELSEDIFESLVERITVASEIEVKIRLHNGLELSEAIERVVR